MQHRRRALAFLHVVSLITCALSASVSPVKRSPERNPDAITFPKDIFGHINDFQVPQTESYTFRQRNDDKTKNNVTSIPVAFIQQISNYTVDDLLIHYVDNYEDDPVLTNRFGEDVERSPAVTPKSAKCMPELQTVKLITSADPSVVYIPTCTRIERCGGCCSHNLLTCEAVETEPVSFKVVKTQFTAGNRLKFVGKEIVHMEKHTKCSCGCKIKAKDCNTFQEYRLDECRCVCINNDEEGKCYKDEKKLWDPETCSCRCREVNECSTGYSFDVNRCKCTPVPRRLHPGLQVQETIDLYDE